MPSGFAAALVRHGREVAKLEGAQAAQFLVYLRELRDSLVGRLTTGDMDRPLDAFRLRQVLAETQAGIDTLTAKAGAQYGKAEVEAAELAASHLEEELDRMGRAFDREPLSVTIDAAASLADPNRQILAEHFETSVDRYGGDVLNGVRRELFMGLRTGDPMSQVVASVGKVISGSGGNAERLVRTETSQAYGNAQHDGLTQAKKQVPGLKKVWLHIASYRCETCMPLHGTERDLDGFWVIRQGKRSIKVTHAPAHPNCACRVSAMKPSWRSAMQKLGYLEQDPDESDSKPSQL